MQKGNNHPETVLADVATTRLAQVRDELVPPSFVIDVEQARAVATAEKPFRDELIDNKDNNDHALTTSQIFQVGMRAAQAVMAVEQGWSRVASDTEDIPARSVAVQGSRLSESLGNLLDPTHEALHTNLTMLEEGIEGIFNSLRSTSAGLMLMDTTNQRQASNPNNYLRCEIANMYDPESGTVSRIWQQTLNTTTPRYVTRTIEDIYIPIDAGKTHGKRLVVKGNRAYQRIEEDKSLYASDATDMFATLGDQDPTFIAEWATRLSRSFPLTDKELEQLFEETYPREVTIFEGSRKVTCKTTLEENIGRTQRVMLKQAHRRFMSVTNPTRPEPNL